MTRTLDTATLDTLLAPLHAANARFARRYPGEPTSRQPVHTVYGGADRFRADTAAKLGQLALRALDAQAPDPATFAQAIGLKAIGVPAGALYARVREKLQREPVEDFRLDFEDGYGNRPDEEEDACAADAARQVAAGLAAGTLPPFLGIRIKPLSQDLHGRALRTLDLFLTTLIEATDGALPAGFVVTLPKVEVPEQSAALVATFEALETALGLTPGALKFELMVETPRSVLNLPQLVAAGNGRCTAAHFGVYDYTASLSITAAHQSMVHPACDIARNLMQIHLAGSGVMLSDGATNVLPVGPHRQSAGGPALSAAQEEANRQAVHDGWHLHFAQVRHSLVNAIYQGWDLHPAQLPTRYAALYSFFLEGLVAASERLRTFVEQAAQATLIGDVMDDAATGQGLLNFFLRGLSCGAITEEEALATGLSRAELETRSFYKILALRRDA